MAASRSLAVIAERAGTSDDTTAVRAAAEAETKAADEIAGLIEPVTRIYLDVTCACRKADG